MQEGDSAAVARARGGEDDAYRTLVERHSRALFRLAFRMTGNEQDAEDVVQETLLKAYRQLHRYESRASFSTWLHRIAANCSLDLIRSRKRRQETTVPQSTEPGLDVLEHVAADEPGPEKQAYATEVQRRVAVAMEELTRQERVAFTMRHFEGHSIEEIGAALGLNQSAAKHSIFRAVQKLRRSLEPLMGSTS
jgi:RNA polymerase sigma-70 factor, ECF subfamily